MEERRSAGGAGGLEPSGRNAADAESSRHVRGEMILPDERRPGEIPQIKRLDAAGLDIRILQGLLPRFHSQRAQIPVGKRAERRLAHTNHSYTSHTRIQDTPGRGEPRRRAAG